jgi:predicted 3-demethylubiquinone-9 3-methyltransferase (glyoxalase superfamily)
VIASTLVLPIERVVINWHDGKSAPIRAVPRRPGTDFMAMGREHPFSFTVEMSLFVDCDCQDGLDPLHSKLVERMPLAEYPLSPRFGGVQHRFGASRQRNLVAREPGEVV